MAVRSQSIDAVTRAAKIVGLRERYRAQATELGSVSALQLIDLILLIADCFSRRASAWPGR